MLIVSVPLRTSSQHTTNSSPPNRATVSDGRTVARSRAAASTRIASPHACPSESLTSLKWSRSRNSSATLMPSTRSARLSAWPSRSTSSVRLGRPVSASCSVWCSSSWALLALLGDVDRVRDERDDRSGPVVRRRSRGAARCTRVPSASHEPVLGHDGRRLSRRSASAAGGAALTRSSGCTTSTKPARSTWSRPSSSHIAGLTATISPAGSWIAMPTGACSNARRNGSTLDRRDRHPPPLPASTRSLGHAPPPPDPQRHRSWWRSDNAWPRP